MAIVKRYLDEGYIVEQNEDKTYGISCVMCCAEFFADDRPELMSELRLHDMLCSPEDE